MGQSRLGEFGDDPADGVSFGEGEVVETTYAGGRRVIARVVTAPDDTNIPGAYELRATGDADADPGVLITSHENQMGDEWTRVDP